MKVSKSSAACLISGVALVGLVGAGTSQAGILAEPPQTLTFECTGTPETWTVPEGVTEATFELAGARGGDQEGGPEGDAGAAGNGATVTMTIPVTPGEVITINVGCAGGTGGDEVGGAGGYGGGGDAGGGSAPDDDGSGAGGGGGSSDVRQGGTTLTDRVLVAGGGGGGAAGGTNAGNGGVGGTPDGTDGTACDPGCEAPAQGGDGGTTTAAGAGGAGGGTGPGANGQPAAGAVGGDGGAGDNDNVSGGGGGGGYFGGGGGGGGSQGTSAGGGGGGGSSFGPAGAVFGTNDESADGFVTITFAVGPITPPPAPIVIEPRFTG